MVHGSPLLVLVYVERALIAGSSIKLIAIK